MPLLLITHDYHEQLLIQSAHSIDWTMRDATLPVELLVEWMHVGDNTCPTLHYLFDPVNEEWKSHVDARVTRYGTPITPARHSVQHPRTQSISWASQRATRVSLQPADSCNYVRFWFQVYTLYSHYNTRTHARTHARTHIHIALNSAFKPQKATTRWCRNLDIIIMLLVRYIVVFWIMME